MTGQALMAVNGAAFPLNPVPRAVSNVVRRHRRRRGGWRGVGRGLVRRQGEGQRASAAQGGSAAGHATEQDQPVPITPASSSVSGNGGDGGVPGWLIGLGIVVLGGAIVWAGWLRYRRRLPSR